MTNGSEIAAATLLVASLTSWITDEDWNRLVGPWGGFLVSIILCAILLRHSAKRIKREDDRAEKDNADRERRHQEALQAQVAAAAKYEGLTREVMAIQVDTAKVMMHLSKTNEALHEEMRSRPCQIRKTDPQDESTTV